MIEDNIQSLKDVPKCNDLIMQELPNLVNTKLSEERKQFLLGLLLL
jgi:hypothetical protein